MSKRMRQYIGIFCAILFYYIIHEGAHFLIASFFHAFKGVNFMALGMQVDIFREKLSDTKFGIFCIAGAIATLIAAYILVCLIGIICKSGSKLLKACFYYVTVAMLILDPIYLSILCGFFGGGDMNGIVMLMPQGVCRAVFAAILIFNIVLLIRRVIPAYTLAFKEIDERGDRK